jgi:hypothetical protein
MSASVTSTYSMRSPSWDARFDLALVLVQERDRVDQREILLVIAPQPRALIREGQRIGVGVADREGRSSRCAF